MGSAQRKFGARMKIGRPERGANYSSITFGLQDHADGQAEYLAARLQVIFKSLLQRVITSGAQPVQLLQLPGEMSQLV